MMIACLVDICISFFFVFLLFSFFLFSTFYVGFLDYFLSYLSITVQGIVHK